MKKCKFYSVLISRQLDDDLNESEKIDLKYHLTVCHRCHKLNESFINLNRIIKGKTFEKKRNLYLFNRILVAACIIIAIGLGILFYNYGFNIKKTNEVSSINVVEYPIGDLIYSSSVKNDFDSQSIYEPMNIYYELIEE
jgi:hypothetical protein